MSTDKRVHVLGRKFAKPCPVLGPICIVAHTFVVLLLSRRVVNSENCYKQKNLKYISLEAWFRVNYKKKMENKTFMHVDLNKCHFYLLIRKKLILL